MLIAVIFSFLSSFFYDAFLGQSVTVPWRRHRTALSIHCATWFLAYASLLLLCQRPWFTVVLINAGQLLLLLVHRAKYHNLRESFIYQDFDYFTDAIKHPRLYLPFFGVVRTLIVTFGFISAITLGLLVEAPLSAVELVTTSAGLLIGTYYLYQHWSKHPSDLSFDPEVDLAQLGQIAFLWAYWRAECETKTLPINSALVDSCATINSQQPLANIVIVQSESFFDARDLCNNIYQDVLTHFDAIKSHACCHGKLHVPAWGANTVRSEAGFLTALSAEQLGIHRFNPYRLMATQKTESLISLLKQHGYHTIAVHPYPASFYQRNDVFPLLGFDEFLDITAFDDNAHKSGQFISDRSISEKIKQIIQHKEPNKPYLIFVITMENHGPLHLENPCKDDWNLFYKNPVSAIYKDLTVYLKHLKNADQMIADLQQVLLDDPFNRTGILCWYGDHVPIMPEVYQQLGDGGGLTDYFIWKTNNSHNNQPSEKCDIHNLPLYLCKQIAMD